jgi:hypothetical protein
MDAVMVVEHLGDNPIQSRCDTDMVEYLPDFAI